MNPMHIVLLYDHDALTADAASQDVASQMSAIEQALAELGATCTRLGATLDLARCKEELYAARPDLVFNLVESLDESDRLQTVVAMLLEEWRIPFTGNRAAAMMTSNDKIETKRRLHAASLPTAPCAWLESGTSLTLFPESAPVSGDWITKASAAHASVFMDADSVLRAPTAPALAARLAHLEDTHGQPFFAEQFMEGREFNLSLLESGGHTGTKPDPLVLPIAEIRFDTLPPDHPPIVGYAAKWDESSTEYTGTPRTFTIPDSDTIIVDSLRRFAIGTWHALSLSGYARVDFRLDNSGDPCILEANTNPCLSPDAGFAAAAAQAGLTYTELIKQIMDSSR